MAPELKLTKNAASDKEGVGLPLRVIAFERIPDVEPRRFSVLSADIKACGVRVVQCWRRTEERSNHRTNQNCY